MLPPWGLQDDRKCIARVSRFAGKIDENLLVKVSESLPELPDFYKVEVEKVLSLMHKEQLQPDETLNLMRGLRGIIEQLKSTIRKKIRSFKLYFDD